MERPPPPQGQPPPYAFVGRVYKRSLRPMVLGCCTVAAAWAALWGISELVNVGGRYKVFDIVTGALYLGVMGIEIFGAASAWKQSIPMVRIYSLLSVVAALIVLGVEISRVAIYFSAKRNLISDCTQNSEGITIGGWNSVWGGGWSTTLTGAAAQNWCENRWSRGVWGAIAWLVVAVLLGWLFSSMAFSYYHQLLSPQTIAPSQAFRMGAFPHQQQYGQSPYNPQGGYQYPAPRPGPQEDYVPPYDPHKVPDYDETSGQQMPRQEKESDIGLPSGPGYSGSAGDPFGDRHRNV